MTLKSIMIKLNNFINTIEYNYRSILNCKLNNK